VLSLACGTDGSGAHALIVPTGGMRAPHVEGAPVTTDASGNVRTVNDLYMDGGEIFAFTLREVPPLLDSLLAREGLTRNDVDLYVFHQANSFMLEHLRRKLQIPADRFVVDMQDCGNTVSSTIPIALARAINAGRVRPGMRVALVGFGVGLSWAGALVLWG
jgi:3-oxoacyl-[acyl-carrier-protein] synthase-3